VLAIKSTTCYSLYVMKKITLKEAYDILEKASAVIIDDNALVYRSLWELDGNDENEFLYLSWENDRDEYNLKFCEGDNKEVKVSGSSLFLYDTDADDETCLTKLTILVPQTLE